MSQLKPTVKKKISKRLGRGTGSGSGKTAGRGHKGAGQRKGTVHYIGHLGDNVPLFRKIPKRGFTSVTKNVYQTVNIDDLAGRFKGQKEITPKELKEAGLIRSVYKKVKILARAGDDVKLSATVKAHKFSKKAKELIEKAGGTAECLTQ